MTVGRKPIPTEIKRMRGTLQPSRMNKSEAQFPIPGKMLAPPGDLSDEGSDLWRSIGKVLLDVGLFTYGDRIALELLCVAYGRMKYANRKVEETGGGVLEADNGNLYHNPWLAVANKSWEQVKGMLGEFGLTPAERTRVIAAIEQEEDDLADLLFRPVPLKESDE